jgi:hypothetical protein
MKAAIADAKEPAKKQKPKYKRHPSPGASRLGAEDQMWEWACPR